MALRALVGAVMAWEERGVGVQGWGKGRLQVEERRQVKEWGRGIHSNAASGETFKLHSRKFSSAHS